MFDSLKLHCLLMYMTIYKTVRVKDQMFNQLQSYALILTPNGLITSVVTYMNIPLNSFVYMYVFVCMTLSSCRDKAKIFKLNNVPSS